MSGDCCIWYINLYLIFTLTMKPYSTKRKVPCLLKKCVGTLKSSFESEMRVSRDLCDTISFGKESKSSVGSRH